MEKNTTRKCIVTQNTLNKDNLLRFVLVNEQQIVPDFKKKIAGSGVYVVNAKSQLEKAVNSNLFAKAFKKKVTPDNDLPQTVENILKAQALHAISLARKAGALTWGLDKALEIIKKGQAAFILEAKNAGADGHKKMLSHAGGLELYNLFTSEELDKELNKENTVHLVFIKSNISNMVKNAFIRLTSYLNN